MTVVIVALAAEVVPACPVVTGRLAGVIAGKALAVTIAGGVAGVVCPRTTATLAGAMTATISTAVPAAVTTTISAATATAFFCNGSVNDRQISGEKWGCGQHQGAGHDSDETFVF